LGGIFDPPHYGHIALAEKAVDSLNLNKIICVPSKVPPHKTAARFRPKMTGCKCWPTRLKARIFVRFQILRFSGKVFRNTATRLKFSKVCTKRIILFFIIGADNIAEIENWHEPDEIISLVTVAAFTRPGFSQVGKFSSKIRYFEMDPVDISSSMIRDLVKEGRSSRRD